jgi:hypothetical protein
MVLLFRTTIWKVLYFLFIVNITEYRKLQECITLNIQNRKLSPIYELKNCLLETSWFAAWTAGLTNSIFSILGSIFSFRNIFRHCDMLRKLYQLYLLTLADTRGATHCNLKRVYDQPSGNRKYCLEPCSSISANQISPATTLRCTLGLPAPLQDKLWRWQLRVYGNVGKSSAF